jgi:hypothetical protein
LNSGLTLWQATQFEQYVDLEPLPCGLYSLGWGFATVIVD